MRAFIGAATVGDGSAAEGIVVADIDGGNVTPVGLGAEGTESPMYLALSPDGSVLYAAHAASAAHVSAWQVDGVELRALGEPRTSGGSGACHLSIAPGGRHLLTANYNSGSVSVHPILGDGALGEPTDVVQHSGSGPNAARQEGPHAHMVVTDPEAGRGHVLVADLGTDTVYRYVLDESSGKLSLADEIRVPAGAGPRHLVVSGRYAYVVNELDSTVSVVDLDEPTVVANVATYPGDDRGSSQPSAIRLSRDGRFLYVANRGLDQVAVLAVDGAEVQLVTTVACGGTHPRDLVMEPAGQFMFVANQYSDTIVPFRVDPATGVPKHEGPVLETPSPACIVFA